MLDPDVIESLPAQAANLNVNDSHSQQPAAFSGFEMEAPPAPKIHSRGITAIDITAHFTAAAERLPMGTLVKDEYFTLFESVGAIELMDPKMDTGFLADGETLEDDYDVCKNLLPEEILGIVDQLLCFEMAWHMGHPLSQTIFTSLYVDHLYNNSTPDTLHPTFTSADGDSETLLHRVLRAYCLGMLKTCWHVNNRIKSEHYYEEEDFVSHTYNRNLLENIEDGSIETMMKIVREEITHDTQLEAALKIALTQRLDFRISFLTTVSSVDDRSDPRHLPEVWNQLLGTVKVLKEAHELGKPVPEAFSVKLQRKLASTVPPRPVVSVAFDVAHTHLERLCSDGIIVSEVLEYHDSQSLITFVSLFQSRKPQPSVYIRTLLQYYLFGDMIMLGTLSIRHVLDDDLANIVLVQDPLLDRLNDEIEVPTDPRHIMAQQMEVFRSRAAQSFLDILRTLCQNRCRVRRTLAHAIADWDNLQLDSEDLDTDLRQHTAEQPLVDPIYSSEPIFAFPLSSWAYFYKLRCLEWSVQMGLELEVYAAWELAGMYWYLYHLSSTRIRHLERIRKFVLHRFSQHKARKLQKSQIDLDFGRSLSFINYSMLEATATSGLASALSTLYAILLRIGAIISPDLPFSTESIRYELRMKPYMSISLPEPISYESFQSEVMMEDEPISVLLDLATDAAARAKKDLELLGKLDAGTVRCKGKWSEDAWKKNLKDVQRAGIMTGIGVASARKGIEKYGDKADAVGKKIKVEVPEVGKGYHDWWIVPKITVG